MQHIPTGFLMTLAQDMEAMERFSALSPQEREEIILRAHHVQSKAEMQAIVRGIGR
ncbi:MAG: hypothetical protein VB049_06870 [Candidatus Pelethousia sp.]|nr:hypothetical protein [Candidatus Pelethousia sp.]